VQVIGEKILVKLIIPKKTAGGLVLPEGQQMGQIKGEVVGIGNVIPENSGCKDLKVGDIIVWFPSAGTWVDIDGGRLVIRPNDIIGKIDNNVLVLN
jgi:co-chaperonin GroES (HSP10)